MSLSNEQRSTVTANTFTEYVDIIKTEQEFILIIDVKKEFCKSLKITIEELNGRLKIAKSLYLYDIVGYINAKPITRFNLHHAFKKLIIKIFKRIEYNNNEKLTFDEKKDIFSSIERSLQCQ